MYPYSHLFNEIEFYSIWILFCFTSNLVFFMAYDECIYMMCDDMDVWWIWFDLYWVADDENVVIFEWKV